MSVAVTQHKNCSQCLAFAQLAGAISGKHASSPALAPNTYSPLAIAAADPATRITLAFRSLLRCPPCPDRPAMNVTAACAAAARRYLSDRNDHVQTNHARRRLVRRLRRARRRLCSR
ncbi:hypothetical protein LP420_00340 [Massilia sp. B-10]|nr:hypothetical protein LP420_00340 [Massilia sp. B-10]